MPRLLAARVAAALLTAAAPLAGAAPLAAAGCSSPARPVMPPTPPAPPSDLDGCRAADAPACDSLAELWGSRELLPPALAEEARAATAALHDACDDRGLSSACVALALMYKYGTATGERDRDTSNRYWARVRELGDLNGFRGEPPSDEGRAALALAAEECAAGRRRACTQLGWAAFSGVQQEKDVRAALMAWSRGCELGSAVGCRWAGHVSHVYAEIRDEARAEVLLRRGCELGNPGGCDELGHWLEETGRAAEALPPYERACAGGSRGGCARLALALHGAGRVGEATRAAEAARAACTADEPLGCTALAQFLDEGFGLPADPAQAARIYVETCEREEPAACDAVAGRLQSGRPCVYGAPPADAELTARAIAAVQAACGKGAQVDGCDRAKACSR